MRRFLKTFFVLFFYNLTLFNPFIVKKALGEDDKLTIWMGSMNIENQKFSQEVLDQMLRPAIKKELQKRGKTMDLAGTSWKYINLLPDIIVFACQECKPNKLMEFPVDTLKRKRFLGKYYRKVTSQKTLGMTKIKGGLSSIYVGVLAKKKIFKKIKRLKYVTSRRKLKLKGAVLVKVSINNKPYAFGSVHLDASSEKKREADISKIYNTLREAGFPKAALLMGDFNYRLIKNQLNPLKNTADYLIEKLSKGGPSHNLLKKRDSLAILLNEDSNKSFSKWGFEVPKYTIPTLPTYKKVYKSKNDKNECQSLDRYPKNQDLIRGCYFKKGNPKEKDCLKGKCIDFGWLDRLATFGVKSPFLIGGPPKKEKKYLKLIDYGGAQKASLGDHGAIWATFESF